MLVALKIPSCCCYFWTHSRLYFLHLFYYCTFQWSSIGSIHNTSHPTPSTLVYASAVIPYCNEPTLHFSNERAHIHTYNTYIGIAMNCALPRRITSHRTMPGRIHPTFAFNDRLNLPYDLHISPVALPDTIAYFHTQLYRHTLIDTIHLHSYTQNGGRARISRTCEKFVRTRYDFICIYLHS